MNPAKKNPDPTSNADRVRMVIVSSRKDYPPVVAALIKQLETQKPKAEFEHVTNTAEIRPAIEKSNMTVLILTIQNKEELVEILGVLGQIETRTQTGLLRALAINAMNHPRVGGLLKQKGVSEILDFNTGIKSLNHKIKNALLLVDQSFQRMQNQKLRASSVLSGDGAAAANKGMRAETSNEIVWEKPIEHPCDFWWIPSAKNVRHVMGRWLIDLLGPGPAVGYWDETQHERNGEKGWQWKLRAPTDPTYQPRSGTWLFFGRQPEFVWQKNIWSFVAKVPYLAFYPEGGGEPEFVRIQSGQSGKLQAYENSEVGRSYVPRIQASLEASLKFSKPDGTSNASDENFDTSGVIPSASGAGYFSSVSPAVPAAPDYNRGDLSRDDPVGGRYNQGDLSRDPLAAGYTQGDLSRDPTAAGFKQSDLSQDPAAAGYTQGDLSRDPATSGFNQGNLSPDPVPTGFNLGDLSRDPTSGEFNPGDLSRDPAVPKFRNALTPTERASNALGMGEIRQAGITAGAKTFEKMELVVKVAEKGGICLVPTVQIHVMDLTPEKGTFRFADLEPQPREKYRLEFQFLLGDVERNFKLEWTCESVQSIEGVRGTFAQGIFVTGSLAELGFVLNVMEQRHLELRDFFIAARGA